MRIRPMNTLALVALTLSAAAAHPLVPWGSEADGNTLLEELSGASVDPRVVWKSAQLGVIPVTSFTHWEPGKEYVYRFESKAAHTETAIPHPEKVNPQTELEDLGMFPYAVLEGNLLLQCLCLNSKNEILFRVSFSDVIQQCGRDAFRSAVECTHLADVARALQDSAAYLTINVRGAITGLSFSPHDTQLREENSPEIVEIKKNLLSELALSTPVPPQNASLFTVVHRVPGTNGQPNGPGATNYSTRFRVTPFQRVHAHDATVGKAPSTSEQEEAKEHAPKTEQALHVDGLIVRKERLLSRLGAPHSDQSSKAAGLSTSASLQMKELQAYVAKQQAQEGQKASGAMPHLPGISHPFHYERLSWSYMVLGGDVDKTSGPAPVPTHVSSIEQVQIDPYLVMIADPWAVANPQLYVLSRINLNLRQIRPVDKSSAGEENAEVCAPPASYVPEQAVLELN